MVIVCQCCEPLFVSNGLWRWSLWLCALSSWRRLDSWGVERLGKFVTTLWKEVHCRKKRTRRPCETARSMHVILIGAGGTGKTTIILELMLDVFCHFFSGQTWRRRSDTWFPPLVILNLMPFPTISIRARTCHTACSYRVASPAQQAPCLENKRAREWNDNNAGCQKFCLFKMKSAWCQLRLKTWCCTAACGHVKTKAWNPGSYFHAGELMGRIPILLIAGDFLQIKPANEISLADNLEELVRKRPDKVQTEHYAAQAALMSIETVIHLKKSKRFLDVHLPEITTAMRTCTPAAPLSEDHLRHLRTRKIEKLQKELEMDFFKHGHVVGHVLGEHWPVSDGGKGHVEMHGSLMCHYFVCRAADQRHARKNKTN